MQFKSLSGRKGKLEMPILRIPGVRPLNVSEDRLYKHRAAMHESKISTAVLTQFAKEQFDICAELTREKGQQFTDDDILQGLDFKIILMTAPNKDEITRFLTPMMKYMMKENAEKQELKDRVRDLESRESKVDTIAKMIEEIHRNVANKEDK